MALSVVELLPSAGADADADAMLLDCILIAYMKPFIRRDRIRMSRCVS